MEGGVSVIISRIMGSQLLGADGLLLGLDRGGRLGVEPLRGIGLVEVVGGVQVVGVLVMLLVRVWGLVRVVGVVA